MREIKFRAWNGKCIVHDFLVVRPQYSDCLSIMTDRKFAKEQYNLDDWEVMQYTDETDVNGIRGCEGDIVKYEAFYHHSSNKKKEYIGQIVFRNSMFLVVDKDLKAIHAIEIPKCEIIGNIYENPEII